MHSLRRGFVTEWARRGGSEYHGRALTGHRPGSKVYQEYQEEGAITENPALAILDNPAGGILGAPAR